MINPNQRVVVQEDGRRRVQTVNEDPSMTEQSEAHMADIRWILGRYEATGVLTSMAKVDLAYRDVSEFTDFADLMQQAKNAEVAFMRLPSKVREVFEHDVANWLDAAHDAEKLEALKPRLIATGFYEDDSPPPPSRPETPAPPVNE